MASSRRARRRCWTPAASCATKSSMALCCPRISRQAWLRRCSAGPTKRSRISMTAHNHRGGEPSSLRSMAASWVRRLGAIRWDCLGSGRPLALLREQLRLLCQDQIRGPLYLHENHTQRDIPRRTGRIQHRDFILTGSRARARAASDSQRARGGSRDPARTGRRALRALRRGASGTIRQGSQPHKPGPQEAAESLRSRPGPPAGFNRDSTRAWGRLTRRGRGSKRLLGDGSGG